MNCSQCGAPLDPNATKCKYCGEAVAGQPAPQQQTYNNMQQPMQQPMMQQPMYTNTQYNSMNMMAEGINPAWPIKSKVVAGVLGILVGGLGIHKFYLGKVGMGILYLLLCWTGISSIVGFIEGIVYLVSDDHNFQVKNHVRLQ